MDRRLDRRQPIALAEHDPTRLGRFDFRTDRPHQFIVTPHPAVQLFSISLGNVGVTRLYKHRFHAVLNIFDGDQPLFDLGLEIRRDFQGEEINDGRVILFFLCLESHSDCVGNLLQIEIDVFPVTFLYLVHCHPFQKV